MSAKPKRERVTKLTPFGSGTKVFAVCGGVPVEKVIDTLNGLTCALTHTAEAAATDRQNEGIAFATLYLAEMVDGLASALWNSSLWAAEVEA